MKIMSESNETILLNITGLTCGHCVASVTEELEEIDGIETVDVSLVKEGVSQAKVTVSTPVDDGALRDAVTEAGYELQSISR